MIRRNAELEQTVRELRARATSDIEALAELCRAYWNLGQQDAAIDTFIELLQRTGQPDNEGFDKIYLNALRATKSCPTPARRRYRLMHLVELLDSTSDIDGLIVECGCYLGLSSFMLCSYLQRRTPGFDGGGYHIFDSFEGLSEPTEDDEIPDDWKNADNLRKMTRSGYFAAPLVAVKKNLAAFPGIAFHPGWIPLSFATMPEASYRFVHVDVDLYDPTLDALNYFYPRLSPGGLIVSDDYSWPGAQVAINEFCADHRVALRTNEVGQAIVVKASE